MPRHAGSAPPTPAHRAGGPVVTLLALAVLVIVAGGLTAVVAIAWRERTERAGASVRSGTVTHDVDGDTVVVHVGDADETVRLVGIDTPETKDPRKPVQCFGAEASAFTASLLPPGAEVRLELDVEPRDRYGRLLAYVYLAGEQGSVNERLVHEGFAAALTIPPNGRFADRFTTLADEARDAGRGLWGVCGGPGRPASEAGG